MITQRSISALVDELAILKIINYINENIMRTIFKFYEKF